MATIKQKLAFQKTLENGGAVSPAMTAANYSPAMAKNPQKLTESKGWQELMEKYLPDDKLLGVHEKALQATKWNDFTGEREDDHTTRLKAVDLAYKVKGHLKDSISQFNVGGDMNLEFTKNE